MTIEWEPAMWSDSLLGTRVKVQGHGVEVVGVLISMKPGAHVLQTDWNGTVEIERPGTWSVFTEKVPAVVLPTEAGIYTGKKGGVWQLLKHDGWFNNGSGRSLDVVRKYAPLTRLRPAAEVASEVLAEVHGLLGYDVDPCGLVAAKYGVTR